MPSSIWGLCCQKPQAAYPRLWAKHPPLRGLAPKRVFPAAPVTRSAVSSYLAISPLPRLHGAVCFLRHYPFRPD